MVRMMILVTSSICDDWCAACIEANGMEICMLLHESTLPVVRTTSMRRDQI
jgi:hypothetical protein